MTFRFDYITKLKDGTLDEMDRIRKMFIALEDEIDLIFNSYTQEKKIRSVNDSTNIIRILHESKAHLEQCQMYSIKLLCLLGEVKDEESHEEKKMFLGQDVF